MNKSAQQIVPDRQSVKHIENKKRRVMRVGSMDKTIPTKRIRKANDSDDVEVIFGETTVTRELFIREGVAQVIRAKQVL